MIYIQSIYKTKTCSLEKHGKKFYKKSMVPEINPNVFTKTKNM